MVLVIARNFYRALLAINNCRLNKRACFAMDSTLID